MTILSKNEDIHGAIGFNLFLVFLFISPYFLISGDNRVLSFLNYIPQKFNLSVLFGAILLFFVIFDSPFPQKIVKSVRISLLTLVCFYCVVIGSILYGLRVFSYKPEDEVLYNFMGLISWTGIIIAGPAYINSKERIGKVLNCIFISISVTFCLGILEWFLGGKRIGGPYSDANYFGRLIIVSFAIVISIFFEMRNSLYESRKKYFIAMFIVGCVLLILTGSRSSVIVFLMFLFIILYMKRKFKLIMMGLLLSIPLLMLYAEFIVRTRNSGFSKGNVLLGSVLDLSNSTRVALDIAAFRMWLDYPILGVGYRNFHTYLPNYDINGIPYMTYVTAVHNWILGLMAEHGLLGLCLFSISIFVPIIKLRKLSKIVRSDYDRFLILAGIFILMAFILHGLFFPPFGQEFIYVYYYSVVLAILNWVENRYEHSI